VPKIITFGQDVYKIQAKICTGLAFLGPPGIFGQGRYINFFSHLDPYLNFFNIARWAFFHSLAHIWEKKQIWFLWKVYNRYIVRQRSPRPLLCLPFLQFIKYFAFIEPSLLTDCGCDVGVNEDSLQQC